MGCLDSDYFFLEYLGVIIVVGVNVDGLNVGDCVCGLGKGQFGIVICVLVVFVSKVEDGDDFVQMVFLLLFFVIVVYVLDYVVYICKGWLILVQFGVKDVGFVFIFFVKVKGVYVFVIVEIKEEVRFIVEKCGLFEFYVLVGVISLVVF